MLRRPNQRYEPADNAPPQEQIQQEDRKRIPFAPHNRNKRRQEVHEKSETKEREEKQMCQMKHNFPLSKA
jgi:hypothetical protein